MGHLTSGFGHTHGFLNGFDAGRPVSSYWPNAQAALKSDIATNLAGQPTFPSHTHVTCTSAVNE